jgi:putative transposase
MPTPYAPPIALSLRQKTILEQIARETTNPYRLVRRVQLVLGASKGESNSALSKQLVLSRNQVQLWRERWLLASESLGQGECEDISDSQLRQRIEVILQDELRSGTGVKFTVEQIVQIVALACEVPASSGRPMSHWSPGELADEATKRGIVERISPRSVGRFLKGSCPSTSPSQVLAEQ